MCSSSTTIARDPVNKIIGDSSLENKFDNNPNDINEQMRIRIHLEYVENLIRNQSSLSLMKSNALDHLNEYWKKGQFPTHNHYQQQQRLPRFIDHNGVHCAVGYMILKSPGFEYLPNIINTKYEYSYMDQIANSNNSDLNKWMNMYEFNLNELSMIQPTYDFLRRNFDRYEMPPTHGLGTRSPAVIYSCLIKNNSDAEVNVQIKFVGIEDHHAKITEIRIAKGEEQRIAENEFEHDEPDGKYHKTIEFIRVRKYDGSTIELKTPFDGVTSPQKDWIFEIDNNSIKSIDPKKN